MISILIQTFLASPPSCSLYKASFKTCFILALLFSLCSLFFSLLITWWFNQSFRILLTSANHIVPIFQPITFQKIFSSSTNHCLRCLLKFPANPSAQGPSIACAHRWETSELRTILNASFSLKQWTSLLTRISVRMLGGRTGGRWSPRGIERNSGTNSDNNPERALSICYSGRQSLDAGDINQRKRKWDLWIWRLCFW